VSSSQLAPLPFGASQSMTTEPPFTDTFLSLPSAKNPTHRPSGEKKGSGPDVPCNGIACSWSIRRMHSSDSPASVRAATNAGVVPSGERASAGPCSTTSDASAPRPAFSRKRGEPVLERRDQFEDQCLNTV
jgi:hypothetical protein